MTLLYIRSPISVNSRLITHKTACIITQSTLLLHTWSAFPLRGSESSTSSMTVFSLATESWCRWKTSSCLNSSGVLVSRSLCLKSMSENIVANVLPSSTAVLVLFYKTLFIKRNLTDAKCPVYISLFNLTYFARYHP